jgi:hypothetical protein
VPSVPIELSRKTEDRAASEAAHCWGLRMSFNASSHKISGLRSPALTSAMSFVAIACLMSSSQSPVRRAMCRPPSGTSSDQLPSGSSAPAGGLEAMGAAFGYPLTAKARLSRSSRLGTHTRSNQAQLRAAQSSPPRPLWFCIADMQSHGSSSSKRLPRWTRPVAIGFKLHSSIDNPPACDGFYMEEKRA